MNVSAIESVVPIIVVLIISIITRRGLFALVCGLLVASLILSNYKISDMLSKTIEYLYQSLSNETCQWLIMVIVAFGMLLGLLEASHAVEEFSTCIERIIKHRKIALIVTSFMGALIFLDDYLITLTVSTTMKGITDKLKIPRSQLAYTVNSVSAPICLLVPISTWGVFYSALLKNSGYFDQNISGTSLYLSVLPILFYGWMAFIIVILQAVGIIPLMGKVKKDYKLIKSEDLKPLKKDMDQHANPLFFLLPILTMVVVTIVSDLNILMGAMASVILTSIIYTITKKVKFYDLLNACFTGTINMAFALFLLVLAFSIQIVNKDLMLTEHMISFLSPIMKGAYLPCIVFIFCSLYAFATGCFWDLAAIIIPIVVPLSISVGVNPLLTAAAVFSGTALGSNLCIFGDGVIMCAQACEIKPIDVMFASLPYSIIAGIVSALLYLGFGFFY
ncbi:hypothetical protein NE619_17305 [Anaerovorax odorimutans]|uniref:Na+/H+ antiporter NhaC-like C-terminal domain-containing protein n=1 Tax=Anaerovorax odorimutans TaxID=109327 RepID=A0ABT1RTF9_9FIRM|nr:Na+/H+ antiporter NhaC family protein [Anaerovorax odorimutans]MCQ4638489.1 hypothetical protein [Anaerovorax odorimutans]